MLSDDLSQLRTTIPVLLNLLCVSMSEVDEV